jgi:hypothetical protein
VAYTRIDRCVEHPDRSRHLILDQRCHEEEHVDPLKDRGIDSRVLEVERSHDAHVRQGATGMARRARADANLRTTGKEPAANLSTDRTGRSSEKSSH